MFLAIFPERLHAWPTRPFNDIRKTKWQYTPFAPQVDGICMDSPWDLDIYADIDSGKRIEATVS
jgi:hypothetical protein